MQRPAQTLAWLTLEPVALPPDSPRAAEWSGLLTASLELGLGDLEGVVPQVQGLPRSPGLELAVLSSAQVWTLAVSAELQPERTRLEGVLCVQDGPCVFPRATEPTLPAAVAALLEEVSLQMVRRRSRQAAVDWAEPQSADPYAVLLAGRAAAVYYGLLPAPADDAVGDKRRDPIARALLVDPRMPVARWVAGRRALARGEAAAAQEHLGVAAARRPSSAVLAADEAEAWRALERWEEVGQSLAQVRDRAGEDLRFALPRARAALALGLPAEAQERLAPLDSEARLDARLAALRVAAAEALGLGDPYDLALEDWELADPRAAEPTRRRAMLRVRRGHYEEALRYAAALGARGQAEEAAALELALLVALRRWEEAADRAGALGLQPLDRRLRAREAPGPEALAALLQDDPDPYARVARGEALLALGQPDGALALADAALVGAAWLPEALTLRAQALLALGRTRDAAQAQARAVAVLGEGS